MVTRIVWVLNLDAEDELAHKRLAFSRSKTMSARIKSLQAVLMDLIGPGNLLLEEYSGGDSFGRAWCPTPAALRMMKDRGVRTPSAPRFEILRAVNHRHFCARLGQTLPGAAWVENSEALESLWRGSDRRWVLKRPFGFAGRGRRVMNPTALDEVDRGWLRASFERDGVQAEPWVERLGDFAIHGYLRPSGEVVLGAPTQAEINEQGAWIATQRTDQLSALEMQALDDEARRVADALRDAGYFGAFNVDAYRWRDASGEARFQPRSEINARYSMGWAKGMAEFRPEPGEP